MCEWLHSHIGTTARGTKAQAFGKELGRWIKVRSQSTGRHERQGQSGQQPKSQPAVNNGGWNQTSLLGFYIPLHFLGDMLPGSQMDSSPEPELVSPWASESACSLSLEPRHITPRNPAWSLTTSCVQETQSSLYLSQWQQRRGKERGEGWREGCLAPHTLIHLPYREVSWSQTTLVYSSV